MKKPVLFFILMLGILPHLFSQHRVTFELNGGASFATQDLADANLNTGSGFEGILEYRLVDQLNIYGGWGWNRFYASESFAGPESDFEETGNIWLEVCVALRTVSGGFIFESGRYLQSHRNRE